MCWFIENSGRLLHERSEIESLAGKANWISASKWRMDEHLQLKLNVDIVIGCDIYEIELIYPEFFPDTPAYIRPRSPTQPRWSSHQYIGGVLCLEWGPDNWNSEITGAVLLQSAYKLLAAEASTSHEPVPSRHALTLGQEIRSNPRRLAVSEALSKILHESSWDNFYSLATHSVLHQTATVLFVSEVKKSGNEPNILNDLPSGIIEYWPIFALKGRGWLFKSSHFTEADKISDLESILKLIHGAGFSDFVLPTPAEGTTRAEYLFLFVGLNNEIRACCIDVLSGGPAEEYSIVGLSRDEAPRLPSYHTSLADKKVGIVGLGSVGSKVAVSLARSGIKQFLLIDDDIMLHENVCRHELDWASVGTHKTDSVKEAISLVGPSVDIQVRRLRIGGQESPESAVTALYALATCDILIDATANPAVFVLLAAIAKTRKRSIIWGEIFAGGIGCLLIRSRPEEDPPPLIMRAGVHDYLATQEPAPFKINSTRYDVDGGDTLPLTAFDADVSQFSAMVTRFAIDTLLNPSPSEFPYSAYLVGFKQSWIFEAPFDTRPIAVHGNDGSNLHEERSTPNQEATDFLLELLNQRANDQPSSAQ